MPDEENNSPEEKPKKKPVQANDPEEEQDEPEEPARKRPKPETSNDVVKATFRKLENRINTLEDKLSASEERNKAYEEKFALLEKTPSASNPEKSILEAAEEWLRPITDIFDPPKSQKKGDK